VAKCYSGYASPTRCFFTDTLVFSELSHANWEAVENMDIDVSYSTEDTATISCIALPGEEGLDISHEGGEYEVFEDLMETLAQSKG
jgi:hypothetical protein